MVEVQYYMTLQTFKNINLWGCLMLHHIVLNFLFWWCSLDYNVPQWLIQLNMKHHENKFINTYKWFTFETIFNGENNLLLFCINHLFVEEIFFIYLLKIYKNNL